MFGLEKLEGGTILLEGYVVETLDRNLNFRAAVYIRNTQQQRQSSLIKIPDG
jgi:hypothetical protein